MYSFTLSSTSAFDVGGWSTSRPGRFTSKKVPVSITKEAEWAPGPVWTVAEYLAPPEFDSRTVQTVASRYTDCTILTPLISQYLV